MALAKCSVHGLPGTVHAPYSIVVFMLLIMKRLIPNLVSSCTMFFSFHSSCASRNRGVNRLQCACAAKLKPPEAFRAVIC